MQEQGNRRRRGAKGAIRGQQVAGSAVKIKIRMTVNSGNSSRNEERKKIMQIQMGIKSWRSGIGASGRETGETPGQMNRQNSIEHGAWNYGTLWWIWRSIQQQRRQQRRQRQPTMRVTRHKTCRGHWPADSPQVAWSGPGLGLALCNEKMQLPERINLSVIVAVTSTPKEARQTGRDSASPPPSLSLSCSLSLSSLLIAFQVAFTLMSCFTLASTINKFFLLSIWIHQIRLNSFLSVSSLSLPHSLS